MEGTIGNGGRGRENRENIIRESYMVLQLEVLHEQLLAAETGVRQLKGEKGEGGERKGGRERV